MAFNNFYQCTNPPGESYVKTIKLDCYPFIHRQKPQGFIQFKKGRNSDNFVQDSSHKGCRLTWSCPDPRFGVPITPLNWNGISNNNHILFRSSNLNVLHTHPEVSKLNCNRIPTTRGADPRGVARTLVSKSNLIPSYWGSEL